MTAANGTAVNKHMLAAGFVSAAELARRTGKALTTIHKLAKTEKIKMAKDGRLLYVDVASAVSYFRTQGAEPLAEVCAALLVELQHGA